MENTGCIGMGNMAGAIVRGFVQKGAVSAKSIFACDVLQDKLKGFAAETGITACDSLEKMVRDCDTVLVALKPHVIEEALAPLRELLKNKALLSVAAGWNFERYGAILDKSTRRLFIMPNTPALVSEGVFLLEDRHSLSDSEFAEVKKMFSALGMVKVWPSPLMDIGMAVTSCAPAFVAMFVEALADAGVMYGIPRPDVYEIVSQAVTGSGKMLLQTKMHPGQLKDMVCSPKGMTIKGVAALERNGLRNALIGAIEAVMAH